MVPAYCAAFLRQDKNPTAQEAEEPHGALTNAFGNVVAACIKVRWLVAIGAAVLFAVAAFFASQMGQELIPPIDAGQFTVYVRMPSGANIDWTDDEIQNIEQAIIEETGKPDPGFALAKRALRTPTCKF